MRPFHLSMRWISRWLRPTWRTCERMPHACKMPWKSSRACGRFFPHSILRDLSPQLRAQGWSAPGRAAPAIRAAHSGEVVTVTPLGVPSCWGWPWISALPKIAAYLVELATGRTLAKAGAVNPRSPTARTWSAGSHTNEHADGRAVLQARWRNAQPAGGRARAGPAAQAQVADAVIVGNTAMHHLFAGLPVEQLGHLPYVAASSDCAGCAGAIWAWSWRAAPRALAVEHRRLRRRGSRSDGAGAGLGDRSYRGRGGYRHQHRGHGDKGRPHLVLLVRLRPRLRGRPYPRWDACGSGAIERCRSPMAAGRCSRPSAICRPSVSAGRASWMPSANCCGTGIISRKGVIAEGAWGG